MPESRHFGWKITAAVQTMVERLETQHLTPDQVGSLASKAGVKNLVVTHLSPGTTDPAIIARYVREIHSNFSGKVTIARDLGKF
jgi:ribonuclease BN (tRNA processing enzyme)